MQRVRWGVGAIGAFCVESACAKTTRTMRSAAGKCQDLRRTRFVAADTMRTVQSDGDYVAEIPPVAEIAYTTRFVDETLVITMQSPVPANAE